MTGKFTRRAGAAAPPAAPTPADIERVIGAAEADDGRARRPAPTPAPAPAPTPAPTKDVKFQMTLSGGLAARTDRAMKRRGMTRVGLVRHALVEFLEREERDE